MPLYHVLTSDSSLPWFSSAGPAGNQLQLNRPLSKPGWNLTHPLGCLDVRLPTEIHHSGSRTATKLIHFSDSFPVGNKCNPDLRFAVRQRPADSFVKGFLICRRQTVDFYDIFQQTGSHVAGAANDFVFAEDFRNAGVPIDAFLDPLFPYGFPWVSILSMIRI